MKTAFVTGATGFVGLNLVEEFLNNNHFNTVICFVRTGSKKVELLEKVINEIKSTTKVVIVYGDITNLESIQKVFPKDVDGCFHLAADCDFSGKHKKRQFKINVEGTINIAKTCLEKGCKKLVYMSTIGVYMTEMKRGVVYEFNEESKKLGKTSKDNYNYTKYVAEKEVKAFCKKNQLYLTIIQPGTIIGPRDYLRGSMTVFIEEIMFDEIPSYTNGLIPWTDANLVAKASFNAYLFAPDGSEYLIGGINASYKKVCDATCELLQKKKLKLGSYGMLYVMGAIFELVYGCCLRREPPLSRAMAYYLHLKYKINDEKAQKELKLQIPPIETTLKKIIEFQKKKKGDKKKLK